MDLLRAETTEGLATYGAEIRLFTRVRPEMLRETVLKFKFHTALLTNVFHLVQLSVTLEILLGLEAFPADLALKFLDLGLVLVMLVEVQRTLARIRRAAYVANARLRIVILHVGRIIGLYFEHFTTLLAAIIIILSVFANVVYLQIRLRTRFKVAQGARMKLRGLVVNLHMPRKIRTGFKALGADRALVRS